MRPLPSTADLLQSTSHMLKEHFLSTASASDRILLRMAMNAISIAERQLRSGETHDSQQAESMRQTLSNPLLSINDGNQELARLIREGKADHGEALHQAVKDHLKLVTRIRLSESNPKVLDS